MRYFDPTLRLGLIHSVRVTPYDWTPGPIAESDRNFGKASNDIPPRADIAEASLARAKQAEAQFRGGCLVLENYRPRFPGLQRFIC
jgi:hypothetical protein